MRHRVAVDMPLTGGDALGTPFSPAPYPTLSVLHSVPDGESHTLWFFVTNTHNTNAIELLGNIGSASDNFNFEVPARSTQVIGPITLRGPCDVELGAITLPNNIKIAARVTVQPYQT